MSIRYKIKYLLSHTLAILAISAFLFIPGTAFPDVLRAALIPSSDSIIYTRTIDSIKKPVTGNTAISLTVIPIKNIEDSTYKIPEEIDLLIPIGQHAFEKTVVSYPGKPILATLISRHGFEGILRNNNIKDNSRNIGAIYLNQPLERYLKFAQLTLPGKNRLGILVSREYKNLITEFDSSIKNFSTYVEIYDEKDNLIKSLHRTMENADVIVALPDSNIYNRRNTHNILLSTYRKFIPLIGFSKSYIKAGAIAGLYSTPSLIGKQTGEFINTLADNKTTFDLPRLHSKYFNVSVNNKVARSLGISALDEKKVTQELLKSERASND